MRLIDADALKKKKKHSYKEFFENVVSVYDIDHAPTIEAEPVKHGRWLPSDKGDCTYICSECGFVRDAYILEEKAYCPRCGAYMWEVKE